MALKRGVTCPSTGSSIVSMCLCCGYNWATPCTSIIASRPLLSLPLSSLYGWLAGWLSYAFCLMLVVFGRVHVSTRGRVSEPPSERANEGLFGLHVTRLARAFETSESQAKAELHFTRVLRSIFVRGRVLDTSDLCIIPGKKVWSISTSVSLLQDDGNAIDALAFAILVSLFHFRRSSVQLVVPPPSNDARLMPDSSVRLCPPVERPPLSLSLSYLPITSTLALLSPQYVFSLFSSLLFSPPPFFSSLVPC